MRGLSWIVVLTLGAMTACSGEPPGPAQEHQQDVINGICADEATFPATVAVVTNGFVGHPTVDCTGTLIAPSWVLAAAHCGRMPELGIPFDFHVYGVTFAADVPDPVTSYLAADAVYFHPGWRTLPICTVSAGAAEVFVNDLMLIHLASPATVVPAKLVTPALDASLAVGSTLEIVGYGRSNPDGTQSCQEADVGRKIHGASVIQELSAPYITFARHGWGPGQPAGLCNGDSGGPSYLQANGISYVAGVHSHLYHPAGVFPDGAQCGLPARDVRLGSNLLWIHRMVALPCDSGLPCNQRCGDLVCDPAYENTGNCPADCTGGCGDGSCGPLEDPNLCPLDCGACGDGACSARFEDTSSCAADCTVCGDGVCATGETCATDCSSTCGDGVCVWAELMLGGCPADCASRMAQCGDGACLPPETSSNCSTDCHPVCGNGYCEPSSVGVNETSSTCPADCPAPACGNGYCEPEETASNCAADCNCDANAGGTCDHGFCGDEVCNDGETATSCWYDCGPWCGNGICAGSETQQSCPLDCGSPPPACGDGVCNGGETQQSCAADCGSPPAGACGGTRTYAASNTAYDTQNYVTQTITLAAGQTLDVGTCGEPGSSASGDTYLRLVLNGGEVAANDDACNGLSSRIVYTAASSGSHVLRLGCFSSSACSGTAAWTIRGGSCGGSSPVELGRIAYWWGKVNVHRAPGGAWSGDVDCSSGASLDPLTYCRKFWPATASVTPVAVSAKTGNIWWTANCFDAWASNGQNEYVCNSN